jgi:hypothetical protein
MTTITCFKSRLPQPAARWFVRAGLLADTRVS